MSDVAATTDPPIVPVPAAPTPAPAHPGFWAWVKAFIRARTAPTPDAEHGVLVKSEVWRAIQNAFAAGSIPGFVLVLITFFQPYVSALPGLCGFFGGAFLWLVGELLKRLNDGKPIPPGPAT